MSGWDPLRAAAYKRIRASRSRTYFEAYPALCRSRASKDSVVRIGAQGTESEGIGTSVYMIDELQIREIVYVNLVLKHDNHAVAAELNCFNRAAEAELADAAVLVIVPDHDLVRRITRIVTSPDER